MGLALDTPAGDEVIKYTLVGKKVKETMVGGFGDAISPDEDAKAVLASVKGAVETKQGKAYTTFDPIHMKTQVVAGTNYMFKVLCDEGEVIHVKVHKPLPHTNNPPVLMNVLPGQTADSSLDYFE